MEMRVVGSITVRVYPDHSIGLVLSHAGLAMQAARLSL